MFLGPAYLRHYIIKPIGLITPPSASGRRNVCSAYPIHCCFLIALCSCAWLSSCPLSSIAAFGRSRQQCRSIFAPDGPASDFFLLRGAPELVSAVRIIPPDCCQSFAVASPLLTLMDIKRFYRLLFFFGEWPCYRQLPLFSSRTLCLCSWSHI